MIFLYRILTFLLAPLVPFYLTYRASRGKEDRSRKRERLGYASLPRPAGKLLWLHAASVGEMVSIIPLMEKYAEHFPQLNLLLTTGTVTSSKLAATRLPKRAVHQFVPVDTPQATTRFLSHWQPDAALWVESEYWPNLLLAAHRRGVKMAVINARMSERSYARWRNWPGIISPLLSCFLAFFPGSREDGERLKNLGARNVQYIGNLKFDAPPLPVDETSFANFTAAIKNRSLWLAASTHRGEEMIIANIHRQLKTRHPALLTIIAPRHPTRSTHIVADLRAQQLQVSLRSKNESITADTDIYIADTMGELGLFYRTSNIVFIGGSLVPHGGQNPLEPARLGCAILCGPHMHNFAAILQELMVEHACIQVTGEEQLARTVDDLLTHPQKQKMQADAALAAMNKKQGVVDALINTLTPLLEVA